MEETNKQKPPKTNERIARIKIKREPDFLYYVKADEEGWLCIYKTKLMRGGGRGGGNKKNERT